MLPDTRRDVCHRITFCTHHPPGRRMVLASGGTANFTRSRGYVAPGQGRLKKSGWGEVSRNASRIGPLAAVLGTASSLSLPAPSRPVWSTACRLLRPHWPPCAPSLVIKAHGIKFPLPNHIIVDDFFQLHKGAESAILISKSSKFVVWKLLPVGTGRWPHRRMFVSVIIDWLGFWTAFRVFQYKAARAWSLVMQKN